MSYLRAAQDTAKVYCVAEPIKLGRTVAVYSARLTDDQQRLLATGTYTFFLKEQLGEANDGIFGSVIILLLYLTPLLFII